MESGHARGALPSELNHLLTSQMRLAIDEANLGTVDTQIAKLYYLDRIAQIDIAAEVNYDRSTVSRRLKSITPRISSAASRLNSPQ